MALKGLQRLPSPRASTHSRAQDALVHEVLAQEELHTLAEHGLPGRALIGGGLQCWQQRLQSGLRALLARRQLSATPRRLVHAAQPIPSAWPT